MTEDEWLAATDPTPMLQFFKGTASDRKLRLLAVACCHRNWHLLNSSVSQPGVEVIERYADGLADDLNLDSVRQVALRYGQRAERQLSSLRRPSPEADLTYRDAQQAFLIAYAAQQPIDMRMVLIYTTQCKVREIVGYKPYHDQPSDYEWQQHINADHANLSTLFRDIFGNPFHHMAVDPSWLTSTVVAIATGIYQDRAYDRLPILADALEDSGCDNGDILNHCRSDGVHVRGCWALDLVLGKS